jgi:hypothetical protein
MSRKVLIMILVAGMVLSSLACRLTSGILVERVTPGPMQEEAINVPLPGSELANLTLSFGTGKLNLEGGAEEALVAGTATYNVSDLKPKINTTGNMTTVETGNLNLKGIPNFSEKIENTWDLKLGDHPMNLKIGAGAYEGRLDLGGLSLTSLDISDGAATVRLDFSEPNPVEMEQFTYSTGASTVRMKNLANANFGRMVLKTGAGDYNLDFSGELKRDTSVQIESGISNLVILVPDGTSCQVTVDGGMSSVKTSGNWTQSGSSYALAGSGPTLTIAVTMNAGNLELRTP